MAPIRRLWRRSGEPISASGLIAFRVAIGILMALVPARMVLYGWVEPLFVMPTVRLPYAGFEWVPRPGPSLLYGLLAAQFLGGLLLAAGVWTRAAAAAFFLAFTWVELIDQSTYLNHYYLLSLLTLLLAILPVHAKWPGPVTIPRYAMLWLRAQVAVVYIFAGIAKLNTDWLLHGEPMRTWLAGLTHLPLIGPYADDPRLALLMSVAGCIYDLSIVGLLLWRRSRGFALITVVVFHGLTSLLFPIGLFPWLMIAASTLFCEPDWPDRLLGRARRAQPSQTHTMPTSMAVVMAGWMVLQVALPARGWFQPGHQNWTERGFRFAWRVMLIEKTGLVDFRVVDPNTGRQWTVLPSEHLSPIQHRLMRTQPDMIARFARHLAHEWSVREGVEVAVYADAYCSLNGRPTQRLVDPTVDLSVAPSELPDHWIVPLEPDS
ncbi:MAG TPA: gamma carboxylase [Deltaproteobacteria bacterium]|nr:gamma carboxylase [Deltaproteobacteria bacterium]